jgi:hypothetical protein
MKKWPRARHLFLPPLLLGAMAAVSSILAFHTVWARPYRVGKIPASTLSCGACHINPAGGGARNAFGEDYAAIAMRAGDRYTDDMGTRDSDGDGFTNQQEFLAGTHPGDPNSKPTE